jgi:uncharacterized protein YfaS (alpha-2-macroglobulin family)
VYWQGNSTSDLHITPYILRSLVYMRDAGVKDLDEPIAKTIKYLKENLEKQVDDNSRAEIFWALAAAGEKLSVWDLKD